MRVVDSEPEALSSPSHMSELTTVSYVVLGLVGEHGEGAHDLVQILRRGNVYYAVAPSQVYAEPQAPRQPRLPDRPRGAGPHNAAQGLLAHCRRPQGTARLDVRDLPRFPACKTRPLYGSCLLILHSPSGCSRACAACAPRSSACSRTSRELERRAEALPHRRANLALVNWLGRRWCELLLEWLDEAERVLGEQSSEGRR